MKNNDELSMKLKAIGLTTYEIKTYTAMANSSEKDLTADDIHKLTSIPTPRIYDTIESLADKGLVKIIPGRPKRFKMLQPLEALNTFIKIKRQEYEKQLKILEDHAGEIAALLGEIRINPDELLEAYSSLEEMEYKTIELIANAKHSVDIFTNVFYWFPKVEQELSKAVERGVEVRVIMTTKDEKAVNIARNLNDIHINVKYIENQSVLVRGTLVDDAFVVFIIWISPKTREKYIYRPHFSSNPGIIELFSNNFEYLWEKGKEFV